ncbi:MAG: hypothetical protein M3338_06275 [Actinomycetota bacterium]|nr:hypothetical protein [Actinomycetota bacterium]
MRTRLAGGAVFGEGFEVVSVARRGWEDKEDGDLLAAAQREFDVFLTMDQGIPHQQNLEDIRLVICFSKRRATV